MGKLLVRSGVFLVALFAFAGVGRAAGAAAVVGSDEAAEIVKDHFPKFHLSIWAGMGSWVVADLNGDGVADFAALAHEEKASDSKAEANQPTHVIVLHGKKGTTFSEKSLSKWALALDQGSPQDSAESFKISRDAKFLKSIGCPSRTAVEMYEEASTKFYMCWDGKKYGYFRDPEDTP